MRTAFRRVGRTLVPLALAALTLTGCGAAGRTPVTEPAPPPATPATTVDPRAVQANVQYSLDLLHSRLAEEPTKNHFLSPASAQIILALTANGARGDTQAAMRKSLALDGLSLGDMNQQMGALQSILAQPDPKAELTIANAIWYKQGYQMNADFQTLAAGTYRAATSAAAFGEPAAAKAINAWTAKATKDRIPTIVEKTDAGDRMYLVNAIYFKAPWQSPFAAQNTHPEPFHQLDGATADTAMMTQHRRFRYLQGDNFQAVALPYGEGRLSMYVFLPNAGVKPADFYHAITANRWTDWMGQFGTKEGTLTLPKLKLEYEADLIPAMKKLGMGIAFGAQADFSGLLSPKESLMIGLLKQKTFLQIDENGTEAAAATVVGMVGSAAPAPAKEPFVMKVDRPYFLAIRDEQTGALLFVGAIVAPQAP